jgi:PAS domain-containing protein
MFTSVLPSTFAGQAALLASLVFAAFALATVLHGRLRLQNRRLLSAINNMSQGLCMFDANGRITFAQYALSADVQALARDRETRLHA